MLNFIHEYHVLPELDVTTTENGRFYVTPEGNSYPSVTTVLSKGSDKTWYHEWVARVGQEEADRISKQATTRGTAVHELLEKYLDNNPDYLKGQMPANVMSFKKIQKALDENITKIYRQEAPLYSDLLRTAGRVDVVGEWKGIRSIIDFKTSRLPKEHSQIYNYFMQESFYGYAFYERTGITIPQIVTVITVDDGFGQVFVERTKDWLPKFIALRNSID